MYLHKVKGILDDNFDINLLCLAHIKRVLSYICFGYMCVYNMERLIRL